MLVLALPSPRATQYLEPDVRLCDTVAVVYQVGVAPVKETVTGLANRDTGSFGLPSSIVYAASPSD